MVPGRSSIACSYRNDCNDMDEIEQKRKEAGVRSNERHSKVTAEELARKWNIGLPTAKATLDATTQRGIRTWRRETLVQILRRRAVEKIERRFFA